MSNPQLTNAEKHALKTMSLGAVQKLIADTIRNCECTHGTIESALKAALIMINEKKKQDSQ